MTSTKPSISYYIIVMATIILLYCTQSNLLLILLVTVIVVVVPTIINYVIPSEIYIYLYLVSCGRENFNSIEFRFFENENNSDHSVSLKYYSNIYDQIFVKLINRYGCLNNRIWKFRIS